MRNKPFTARKCIVCHTEVELGEPFCCDTCRFTFLTALYVAQIKNEDNALTHG